MLVCFVGIYVVQREGTDSDSNYFTQTITIEKAKVIIRANNLRKILFVMLIVSAQKLLGSIKVPITYNSTCSRSFLYLCVACWMRSLTVHSSLQGTTTPVCPNVTVTFIVDPFTSSKMQNLGLLGD